MTRDDAFGMFLDDKADENIVNVQPDEEVCNKCFSIIAKNGTCLCDDDS